LVSNKFHPGQVRGYYDWTDNWWVSIAHFNYHTTLVTTNKTSITIFGKYSFVINRVIGKVTLCFTPISSAFAPYPLFQWYQHPKEIWLNLGMKCWVSAFNAQGWRVIILVVWVGAVAVKALRKKGTRKHRMKLGLPPLGPSYFLLEKNYSQLRVWLCRNWPFSPPNCLTLQITLFCPVSS